MSNKSNKLNFDVNDAQMIELVAKNLLEKMEKGMTLKQALGISDEKLEEFYSLAHGFYTQGKYLESLSIFYILASASPSTYKYILGLAASYHQLGGYRDAASGFLIALDIDPNPLAAYYLLDCFLKMDLKEEAKGFASVAIELCEENPEHFELKQRFKLILKSLS